MGYDPSFQHRIFEMLQASQYWTNGQLAAFQDQQLSQLLSFANNNVPFYKNRLEHALTPHGTVNWRRWRDIPILTRDDLHDRRETMLPVNIPQGHGTIADHTGSGTLGRRITTRHNSLMPLVSDAALFRNFEWFNFDYAKTFCSFLWDDMESGKWPEGLEGGTWGPSWEPQTQNGKLIHINLYASPEQLAEFLHRNSVSYFTGRPKAMQSVALATERLGLNTKLSAIPTFGTAVTEDEREDCKRVFDADLISVYASKELYNIAHQCPSSQNLHVNAELMFVEVLDDDGNPCVAGQIGRGVFTSFYNTSQPLIRYDIGDQIILGDRCKCGRTLPVIERVAGRTNHLFRFPNNRKIALFILADFMKVLSAKNWQIAQLEPLLLEVRYIPDGSGNKPNFVKFTEVLKAHTQSDISVRYKEIQTLPLTPSGKFIEYVCELLPSAAQAVQNS